MRPIILTNILTKCHFLAKYVCHLYSKEIFFEQYKTSKVLLICLIFRRMFAISIHFTIKKKVMGKTKCPYFQ